MKNIKVLVFLFLLFESYNAHSQKTNFEVSSPNGEIKVSINLADKIYYVVSAGNETLTEKNHLGLVLKNETLGSNPKLINSKTGKINEVIKPAIPVKFSTVSNSYNYLLLNFKGNYSVEFRAFDEGIAYRFITSKKGEIEVLNEDFSINFPTNYFVHLQQTGNFKTSSEEEYSHVNSSDWTSS